MSDFEDFLNSFGIPGIGSRPNNTSATQPEPVEEGTIDSSPVIVVDTDALPSVIPTTAPVPPVMSVSDNNTEVTDDELLELLGGGTVVESAEAQEIVTADRIEEGEEESSDIDTLFEEDDSEGEDVISRNSPTLLEDNTTVRFSGATWYNEIRKSRVILAGVGGIGSNTAFQIARMCPEVLYMYDDDVVESSNMSGQLFSKANIGEFKVNAIVRMIKEYTSANSIYAVAEKYTETSETSDIMICGFDNMKARKVFFNSWVRHVSSKNQEDKKKCLFIDGRLSVDTLQVLCIQGDDDYNIQRYTKQYLFDDSEAEETICSLKQTTYMACMISSMIVNLFTNFIANTLNPDLPYELPFFIQYDAQSVWFKREY